MVAKQTKTKAQQSIKQPAERLAQLVCSNIYLIYYKIVLI